MSEYKLLEDSPSEISISTYWKVGGMMYLRSALPYDHEENQWNWFRKNYPDLNPNFYGIKHPLYEKYKDYTREELINLLAQKESELLNFHKYN